MTAPGPHSPPDRFVCGEVVSPIVPWAPDDPAELDQTPYLDYLARTWPGPTPGHSGPAGAS